MDLLQRTARQFFELYRSMAPSQRATLVAVPLLVIAGFAWLLYQGRSENYTALSFATTEEIIAAEQALIQEGIKNFKREGQRLLVPLAEVDRCNAALMKLGALPSDLGSQLLKQYESMGPFSTEKERQERKDAILHQAIRRILRAVPEIENAEPVIAGSGKKGWSQKSKVTATISVRTRAGRELSGKLVTSIRAMVATMVPDLQPSDVTVFDVLNGVSHTGESADDPFNNRLVQRIDEFRRQYEKQIEQDLSYIPDVGVTVNVDLDNLKASVTRNQKVDPKTVPLVTQETKQKDTMQQHPPRGEGGVTTNRPSAPAATVGIERNRIFTDDSTQSVNGATFEVTEKQLIAAMPKAVQVSVTIPREFYSKVAAGRKAAGEPDATKIDVAAIEKEYIVNVTKSVKALIPADSPATAIIVNSVDRIVVPAPTLVLPWTDRVNDWIKQWGGTAVLCVLAAFALLTLRRSMPALPSEPVQPATPLDRSKPRQSGSAAAEEDEVPKQPTRRDILQNLVRDNPEATATVITKWLQAAK